MAINNNFTLTGNLVRDPQRIELSNGDAKYRMTVAATRPGAEKKGAVQTADFIGVEYYAKQGFYDPCATLGKGSKVQIGGRLESNTWTDNAGKTHFDVRVAAKNIGYLSTPVAKTEGTSAAEAEIITEVTVDNAPAEIAAVLEAFEPTAEEITEVETVAAPVAETVAEPEAKPAKAPSRKTRAKKAATAA